MASTGPGECLGGDDLTTDFTLATVHPALNPGGGGELDGFDPMPYVLDLESRRRWEMSGVFRGLTAEQISYVQAVYEQRRGASTAPRPVEGQLPVGLDSLPRYDKPGSLQRLREWVDQHREGVGTALLIAAGISVGVAIHQSGLLDEEPLPEACRLGLLDCSNYSAEQP